MRVHNDRRGMFLTCASEIPESSPGRAEPGARAARGRRAAGQPWATGAPQGVGGCRPPAPAQIDTLASRGLGRGSPKLGTTATLYSVPRSSNGGVFMSNTDHTCI